MNGKTIGYWATTGLFSFALGASGILYLSGAEPIVDAVVGHLGYPPHVVPLLGVAKTLGVIALLAPGFAKLKEWAYAGFVFNLIGAFVAHVSVGDAITESIAPVVLLGMLVTSYVLRPASRRADAGVSLPDAVPAK